MYLVVSATFFFGIFGGRFFYYDPFLDCTPRSISNCLGILATQLKLKQIGKFLGGEVSLLPPGLLNAHQHYTGSQYTEDTFPGGLRTFRYDAADGPVHVWQHAFDIRDLGSSSEVLIVLYHYTNELAFRSIGNLKQTAGELFASLVDSWAHFGKGIYATRHEPCVWATRLRVLLNSYSNGSPLRGADAESERVQQEWGDGNSSGHRAAFCVPILAPKAMAYNIFERQTPDLAQKTVASDEGGPERLVRLGEDYKGRAVDPSRDVWVVRATDDSGAVSNVSAEADSLLQLLRLRLAHLRKEKRDADEYTLHCMHDFARRLNARAQYDEAESLYRECWASRKQTLGENHTGTLAALGNLARLVKTQGRLEEALLLQRQAVEGCRSSMGSEHPDTMSCVNNLASLLQRMGRLEEAAPLYQEALHVCRAKLGNDDPKTMTMVNNLASLLRKQGRLEEAEPLHREAVDGCRAKLGATHPNTLACLLNLAALLESKGSLEESERLHREGLGGLRAKLGDGHPNTLTAADALASLLTSQGRLDEAEPLLREALDGRRAKLSDTHPTTLLSAHKLAGVLEAQGHLEQAESLYREALEGRRGKFGEDHADTRASANSLAELLKSQS